MTTTNDIDAIRSRWLNQCGSCDAGLPTECTHPEDDERPVIAALCDEVEQLRESARYYSALVGERNAELAETRDALTQSRQQAATYANEIGALKADLERTRAERAAMDAVVRAAIDWHAVVGDEGHNPGTPRAALAQAVTDLLAAVAR